MLQFRLLGTLEVDGGRTGLGSGKQRALLAYLLLRRNQALPREVLIDALWGDDPPATAAHALDVYASRLRKTLGNGEILDGRHGSFTLNVADELVDVGRFERLLIAARDAPDPAERLAAADEGLALWRGHALADVRDEPFARAASERLEEERLIVGEERFEALLALGRHDETIGDLQAFVREHPLRERPRRQLMLALYRTGRQSDALEVYRQGRMILQDELGLEPSRELRELEAAILQQNETLDAPAHAVAGDGDAPLAEQSPHLRRRLLLVFAAVAVVGAASAAVLLIGDNGAGSLARIDFNGVGAIDPASGRIVSEVIPSASPGRLATNGNVVWTTNQADDTVSGIDTSTQTVVHTIAVGSSPAGIAAGGGAVWVANTLDGTVSRIDPTTERVVQTITVGNEPTAVTYGRGSVWVTNAGAHTLSRIDPLSGHVFATITSGADGRGIVFGAGSLWVIDQSSDSVMQIDPQSGNVVRAIRVGSGPTAIASAFGSVWVANAFEGTVSRINAHSGVVAGTIDVGGSPTSLAATARQLWVADQSTSKLLAIDPATGTIARSVQVGSAPVAIAATPNRLWLSTQAAPATHRGGTMKIVSPLGSFDSPDTALAYVGGSWSVLTMTNDGLVGFRRASGSDGTQIVPDLATSIPIPRNGGTTYTFQVRRGVRYSNGATVSPADFRFALERDFKLHSPGIRFYAGLVGATACIAKPDSCDLSAGVIPDASAGTVTFRLTAPDPEFLDKLALPFADALPVATTSLAPATKPLPATGPYTFAKYIPQRGAVLVRNPNFRVWSVAAQPQGFPSRIVWNASTTLDRATTAIERNRADVLVGGFGPPPARLEEVETRYASQVHSHPLGAVQYVFLNTRRPPFNDVGVRKALNYALDRDEIVRLHGGSLVAQPTCQILPPLIPGYHHNCPYGHNLAKARALVAASGTRGMRVALWSYRVQPYATEMQYVATVLGNLGYHVTMRQPGDSVYYTKVFDSKTAAQAGILSWIADYPAPGDFLGQLGCAAFQPGSPTNINVAEYCDKRTDALVARAERLEPTDPAQAATVWMQADRRVVDRAAYAPMYVLRSVDLVSHRVGNYEFNPQWGVLVDQLWVH